MCAPAQLRNYYWAHSRRNLRETAKTFPLLLPQYCSGDEIEKNRAGGVYKGFWWENLRERDSLEDPGVDGTIIFRWIFRKWDVGGMEWIELSQDRDRWWAIVNAVINFRVP